MMINKDYVVWAYRLLLNREPENEDVIREKCQAPKVHNLVEEILNCDEFSEKNASISAYGNRWVMVETSLGFKIWVNLADSAVSGNIIKGQFENGEINFIKSNLQTGEHFIDIGANLGFYSLLASRIVGESGKVVGFEPLNFLYESAVKSVNENSFEQCKIHNVALANYRGNATLVYAPGSNNWGGAFLSFDGTVLPNHANELVPIAPLEDYSEGIKADFIKIDVEGAEHRVLQSALDYISSNKPIILSEVHPTQLERVSGVSPSKYINMINDLGYDSCILGAGGILSKKVSGSEIQELENIVFIPR